MSYPICVERYDAKHPGDLAICVDCKREHTIDPSSGDPYYMCLKCEACGGGVMWKYGEGETCRNCGKLDWSMSDAAALMGCCSRRCALQFEHAESLKRGAA